MTRAAPQPTLTTPRLLLRPMALDDGADIERLAGVFEVAGTTRQHPASVSAGGAATPFIASSSRLHGATTRA